MTDLCKGISQALGVPVVDGVAAAVTLVESLHRLGLATSKRGEWAYPLAKAYDGTLAAFSPRG
jgi:allantoin racemase